MRIVACSRWDPLHDLLALHERLNRLSARNRAGHGGLTKPRPVCGVGVCQPANIKIKSRTRWSFVASIAGLQEARFHRVERGHGAFLRQFVLSQPVLVDEISAEYEHGVLTVFVPKAAQRSHRVDIR